MILMILRYAYLVFLLGILSILCLFIFLIRPFNSYNGYIFAKSLAFLSRPFTGISINYVGAVDLVENGPYIFIGNHQHNFDVFVYTDFLPPHTLSIGKKALKWIPFFGWDYWLAGHYFINRQNTNEALSTMNKVRSDMIERKVNLLVMPEGTRSNKRGILPFKKGAFRLSVETNIPIRPIVVSTYHKFIDLRKWNAGDILIKILPPFYPKGETKEELEKSITEIRNIMIEEQKKLDDIIAKKIS